MKQYKILLVTFFSTWDNGWYYKVALEKNGHTVIPFDPYSEKDPDSCVLQLVRETKPDFLLYAKNELSVETFRELRRSTKLIMWYPDPVIPDWLPPFVEVADVFFTMTEGLVEEFKKINPNSYWLTQGFEPSFFEIREITERDRKKYSADVAFVGNLGSKPHYLPRRTLLQSVIDNGFKLKWWGPRMPRKFSTVPLLFGKLGRAYGGEYVFRETYAKVARLSKIFLALEAMPHIRKSMSSRMYTAVGCGAFYLCRHVEGIEEILEPGKEIVTFRDEDEMLDMIRYYLRNDALRQRIAEAGRKRVLHEHTYEIRVRQMAEMISHLFD
ncbi:MAG: glycosyltransferase [Nitrospirae bacterium]|nr:glycosyltransferase [Nitrospirota bacterium]